MQRTMIQDFGDTRKKIDKLRDQRKYLQQLKSSNVDLARANRLVREADENTQFVKEEGQERWIRFDKFIIEQ